ncbi:MAG: diguanylate cyclase [Clostridia bacterium]|nr:diguanylate cyclase [Clostridia bacterium]
MGDVMEAKLIDERNNVAMIHYANKVIGDQDTYSYISQIIRNSKDISYIHGEYYGILNRVLYASVHNMSKQALNDLLILKEMIKVNNLSDKYLLDYYRGYALYLNECIGDYLEGLTYLEKGLEIAERINDFQAVKRIRTSLGTVNYFLENYEVAQLYLKNALDYIELEESNYQKLIIMFNYASSLIETKNYVHAEELIEKVIYLAKEENHHQIEIMAISTYAHLLVETNRLEKALLIMDSVNTAFEGYKTHYEINFILTKASLYLEKKDYLKSNALLEKHLSDMEKIENMKISSEYYLIFSKVKAHLNDFNQAYLYLKKHMALQEKINTVKTEEKLNQMMHNEFKKSIRQLETIAEIGRELSVANDIKALVSDIDSKLKNMFSLDAIGIGVLKDKAIDFGYFFAEEIEMPSKEITLDDPNSLAVWCIKRDRSIYISDAEVEIPQYIEKRFHAKTHEGSKKLVEIHSIMYCPLKIKNETIGVFTIQSGKKNAYLEEHKNIFEIIASYVSIAIHNIQQAQTLERLSKTDSLTGIYNRRGFNEFFEKQIHQESIDSIALMIMDLDYFKSINDQYGHVKGDLVLKSVTDVIMKQVDEKSCFARLGGEEFGLLVVNQNESSAIALGNKIREAVETMSVDGIDNLRLTISIGLCICEHLAFHSLDELYHRADKALYRAKENGRNTVIICENFVKC